MTLVAVNKILAGAPVIAGVWRAVVNIDIAGGATPAWRTLAFITLTGLQTAPSIGARIGETGMFRSLAVGSRVTISTGTLVLVRSRVDTRPSV